MREISTDGATPLSRRRVLQAAGIVAVLPVAGCGTAPEPHRGIAATGPTQAGVDRPRTPQTHTALTVSTLDGAQSPDAPDGGSGGRPDTPDGTDGPDGGTGGNGADLGGLLAELGAAVQSLTAGADPRLGGLDPDDLTVTVGIAPALVAMLPGAQDLPPFSREDIPDDHRDGDLMIQVSATQPAVVALAGEALDAVAARFGARRRWSQRGFQATDRAGTGINLLGFADGVVGPRTDREIGDHVWLADPPDLAGATVAVVRRIRVDVTRFLGQPVPAQEAVIGRRRTGGAPLSGGTLRTEPDLGAKTPDGRYLVPVSAHVRRANPLAAGVPPMLRRGYNYDNGPADQGLLFVSYQRSARTFVALHSRLDEDDALMEFTTTTASGAFVILPGFDRDRPLGSGLF